MAEITGYRARWHLESHQGQIKIYKLGSDPTFTFTNPAEFTAVLLMLSSASGADLSNNIVTIERAGIDGQ